MRIQDGHSSRTTGVCTANPCVQLWSHSSSTTRNGDSPKLYRLVVTWLAFCSRSAGLRPNRDASSWRTASIAVIHAANRPLDWKVPSEWRFKCRSSNSAAPADTLQHFQHANSGRQNQGKCTRHTWRFRDATFILQIWQVLPSSGRFPVTTGIVWTESLTAVSVTGLPSSTDGCSSLRLTILLSWIPWSSSCIVTPPSSCVPW